MKKLLILTKKTIIELAKEKESFKVAITNKIRNSLIKY